MKKILWFINSSLLLLIVSVFSIILSIQNHELKDEVSILQYQNTLEYNRGYTEADRETIKYVLDLSKNCLNRKPQSKFGGDIQFGNINRVRIFCDTDKGRPILQYFEGQDSWVDLLLNK